MKTRQKFTISLLAAASIACLAPEMANAQSTYRSDRNGNPVYRPGDDNSGRRINDAISGSLTTRQQRINAGSSVTFGYSITNRGSDTRTYRFPSTRMFDMEAVRVDVGADNRRGNNGRGNGGGFGRRIVWRYSDDQMSGQMLSDFTLRPGQSRSFIGRWQVDRNIPAGTYEVTAFLTPQRDNRVAMATTRIIIENGRGNGRDNDDRWGRDDRSDRDDRWNRGNRGNNDRWNDRDNGVLDVSDLLRSNNSRYVNQRVTVRGIYRSNGSGNNSWLLDSGRGQTLVVTGNLPKNARNNDEVTVTGTLRQSRSGRYTLENN